jgi:hypothetical protein
LANRLESVELVEMGDRVPLRPAPFIIMLGLCWTMAVAFVVVVVVVRFVQVVRRVLSLLLLVLDLVVLPLDPSALPPSSTSNAVAKDAQ